MWHRLKALWQNVVHKQTVEQDLSDELESFEKMLAAEKSREGLAPHVAARAARIEMEGVEQVKESVREVRLGVTLETFFTELRQSLRSLGRNKGLTILCSTMLALGIGSATIIFSIFYAALIRPLPFRNADRLVQLHESRLSRGIDKASFSEANFWDVRAQNHSFSEVAAFHYDEANLTGDGPAEKVTDRLVSAGFFRTLGVSPVLGRDFSYTDDANGFGFNNTVVILGNKFWRSRFNADPHIIGKILRLNDHACVVIGVLPPGEPWIDDQVYQPFGYRAAANRSSWEFSVIARLAPGVSVQRAQTDLRQVAATLQATYPTVDQGIGFVLSPSSRWIASDKTRRALWVLVGAVSFLLFIACLNMANLLLARGTARQREIALRTALGAGRARLVRFVMLESILLSFVGTLLGLGLAYGSLRALQAMEIAGVPRLAEASLNPWVLAVSVLLALLTGVLSGIAPALQTRAGHTASAMRDADHQTGSREQGRLRALLVVAEVALSFLLLVGAGLLIRSFAGLLSVDHGFQTENRLLFSVNMPESYHQRGVGKQFVDRFLQSLSAVPHVIAAGGVSSRPIEGGDTGMNIITLPSKNNGTPGPPPWAAWRAVTAGYFHAVGLPLLRGRLFDERDQGISPKPAAPHRVVISQRLARLLFRDDNDAIGKQVALWSNPDWPAEVVGVVADSRERGPAESLSLIVYFPFSQDALVSEFVLHTRGNPLSVLPSVRKIVAGLDSHLPVSDVRSFEEVVQHSLSPQKVNVALLTAFGGLALLLATTGIYGVLAYTMNRRTAEIGLRVALGASRARILGIALSQGMRPVFVGMLLGICAACWLTRYLKALLFGIESFDVVTYLAVAALLSVTALIACLVPGMRAMSIDPAVALRSE
jgi:putative ABC transport system permease protein